MLPAEESSKAIGDCEAAAVPWQSDGKRNQWIYIYIHIFTTIIQQLDTNGSFFFSEPDGIAPVPEHQILLGDGLESNSRITG